MPSRLAATQVTVECPLCKDTIEVPEGVTRTDALAGHIVRDHTSKLLPMEPLAGPPLPKGFKIVWPWKKED
jgi:hypothetical protein